MSSSSSRLLFLFSLSLLNSCPPIPRPTPPALGSSPRRCALPLRSTREGPPRPRFLSRLSPFLTRSESRVHHARAGLSTHLLSTHLFTHPPIMKSGSSPTEFATPHQVYADLEARLQSIRVRVCSVSRSLAGQRPPLGERIACWQTSTNDSLSLVPPSRYLPRPLSLCEKRQL